MQLQALGPPPTTAPVRSLRTGTSRGALRPVFAELVGLSHWAAAKALNERGIKTATGKAWTAVQVIRVRKRLADRQ